MRIDEAIHYLDRIKQEYDCSYEEDALNMAIKALAQEPCDDAISREAVLRLFATHDGKYLYEAIRELPSVHPECTEDYCPAAFKPVECEDCISRLSFINKLEILMDMYGNDFYWAVRKIIDAEPSVQPKQTECKDCCNGNQEEKAKLCQKSYLAGMKHRMEQEPCDDVISRQAVLDAIDAKAWEFCDYLISKGRNDEQKPVSHFADNLRECVREELPSVTPAEKVGHWINHKDEHQCSQCREIVIADKDIWEEYPYDYCPNCGAKMQEVEE